MRTNLLIFCALAVRAAAYAPAAGPRARGALVRARAQLSSGGIDATALAELDGWDDEPTTQRHDDYMASLKTGGTPTEERVLEPPEGYVPLSERADIAMGTAGVVAAPGMDAIDKYMATLKREQPPPSDDQPIVLRGDQAHNMWLASLKTGGTPVDERSLEPPPGYIPAMERLARNMGVDAGEVYEGVAKGTADPFDVWMASRKTGGTPEEERDLTVPDGHVPFMPASAPAPAGLAAKRQAMARAVAQPPAPPRQPTQPTPRPALASKPPAVAPLAEPVPAARAQPRAMTLAATNVVPAPAAPAAPARVPAMAMSMTMSAASPQPASAAAIDEAMRSLLTWLAQPADGRRGEAASSMAAAIARVQTSLPAPTRPLDASLISLANGAGAFSALRAARPAPPTVAVPRPRFVRSSDAPPPARAPSPAAPAAAAAPAAPAAAAAPAIVERPRARASRFAYDPEDVEPERLAYEGRGAEELLGRPGAPVAVAAAVLPTPPAAPAPPPAAPAPPPAARAGIVRHAVGATPGLQAYMATLPDEDTPLPSGVEELRGYSTQYKVPGMETMSPQEFRAAMDAKISRTVKEWRAKRPVHGSASSLSYMDSLNSKRKADGGAGGGADGGAAK